MIELNLISPSMGANSDTQPLNLNPTKVNTEDARLFAQFMNPKASSDTGASEITQFLNGLNNKVPGQQSLRNIISEITPSDPIKSMVVLTDYSATMHKEATTLHVMTSITSALVSTGKGLLNSNE
jgi:hypothetical protein